MFYFSSTLWHDRSFTYLLYVKVLHISYISEFYIFLSYSRCTVCCVHINIVFKFLTCTKCSTFLHVKVIYLLFLQYYSIFITSAVYLSYSFTVFVSRQLFTFLTVLQYFYHVNCFPLLETIYSFNTIKTSKLSYTVSNFFLNTFKNTHYMHVV